MIRAVKVRIRSQDLEKQLTDLGSRSNREMRLALQETADFVRDYAKENHEFKTRTGRLERSVRSHVSMNGNVGQATVRLDRRTAKYSNIVHDGAKSHVIRATKAHSLHFFWDKAGKSVFFKSVQHPGIKGDPFLKRAVDETKTQVDDIFREHINTLMRKLRKKRTWQNKRSARRKGR